MNERENWQEAYNKLYEIIQKRQAFEADRRYEPYISYKTTLNYQDIEGRTLLDLAIALGDKEKVIKLYEQGAKTPKALEAALNLGHCEIAKYLYDQGEDAKIVSLCNIKDPDCRKWFTTLLKDNITNLKNSIFFKEEPNYRFFVRDNSSNNNKEKNYYDRIAELGDINSLQDVLSLDPDLPLSLESMLTHAASNNHVPFLRWLLIHKVKIDTKKDLLESALLAVSKTNNLDALDFLIANGADINSQGAYKETPLLFATFSGHLQVVERLISNNADLSATDTEGFNSLHKAVLSNNTDIISLLLKQPEATKLLNLQNIYGMTPLDLAIEKNYMGAIKLLEPDRDTLDQQSAHFTATDQTTVMSKMRYYLSSQYRDLAFFNEDGHCNGFVFLHNLYAKKGDYYYDTLKLMAAWDGTQEALEKPFNDTMPQAKYYKNLAELFEQWTNDIIWFQHDTLQPLYPTLNADTLDQADDQTENREFQYQVVGRDEMKPVCISNPGVKDVDINSFKEDITIFSKRMPSGVRLEI